MLECSTLVIPDHCEKELLKKKIFLRRHIKFFKKDNKIKIRTD